MINLDRNPVPPEALGWFYRLLGSSLIARMAVDLNAGLWRIHTGELFPWRHLPGIPLYPPHVLVIEWALLVSSGLALLFLVGVRAAIYAALLATAIGLSQRFSNQTALTLIVLAFCALSPPSPHDRPVIQGKYPNLALVRYQLLIVYGFSALNKIRAGFLSGDALTSLLHLPSSQARGASWLVVLGELSLPCLFLLGKPRLGLCGVLALHLAFSILMPGLIPFALLMLAMAALWQRFGTDHRPPTPTES